MTTGGTPDAEPSGGRCTARRPPDERDRGAVTVEAALALSTLTVFLVLALGALTAVTMSVRCTDAARELARLAARGEQARGREVAAQLAPGGARIELTFTGDTATSDVSVPILPPLPVRVGGRAVAVVEPGATAP